MALEEKKEKGEFLEDFAGHFRQFLRSQSKDDLEERLTALIEGYNPAAPDLPIIQKHQDRHLEEVFSLLIS